MNCLGSEMDRSHKPGVSQTLEHFPIIEARILS
jgi:hypothetical protein